MNTRPANPSNNPAAAATAAAVVACRATAANLCINKLAKAKKAL